jgi:hypothetical protein
MSRAMSFNLYPKADASLISYNGTNTTRHLASMHQFRRFYAITVLNGGDLLVCGGMQQTPNVYNKKRIHKSLFMGYDDDEPVLAACERYIIANNTWMVFTKLPVPLIGHKMATLLGRVYVFGGAINPDSRQTLDTVYVFDATSATWMTRAKMPQTLVEHTVVALNNATAAQT